MAPSRDHGLGAATDLLGRLEQEAHLARQVLSQLLQHGADAEERGGMQVVPAGVHLARHGAGEGQPRFLLDGKRIHVRADGQDRAGTHPLDDPDNAGPADPGAVLNAEARQFGRHDASRAMLLERKFRVHVQVPADLHEPVTAAVCSKVDGRLEIVAQGRG
jgi:hypothetical protein